MPNVKNISKQQLDKLKHPNSRKSLSLIKKAKKSDKKDQHRIGTQIKHNVIGEKLLWFKERLPDGEKLSKEQVTQLIETYLSRFDEELEQIALKNSVGQRKNRQHASREDIINMTMKKEMEEFNTCGIEMPDLLDHQQLSTLRSWNGELRFLQHFKLKRIARKHLV